MVRLARFPLFFFVIFFCVVAAFVTSTSRILTIIFILGICSFFVVPLIYKKFIKIKPLTCISNLYFFVIASSFLGPVISPQIFFNFGGSFYLYRIVWVIFLFVSFFYIFYNPKLLEELIFKIKNLQVKKYLFFLIFWFFLQIFVLIFSPDLSESTRLLFLFFCSIILTITMPIGISSTDKLKTFFYVYITILVLSYIVGGLELAGYRLPNSALNYDKAIATGKALKTVSKETYMLLYGWGATAFFGNQNNFSVYIIFSLPLVLSGITEFNFKFWGKYFLFNVLLIGVLFIFFLASRSCIVALVIILILESIVLFTKRDIIKKIPNIFITVFVLIMANFLVFKTFVKERALHKLQTLLYLKSFFTNQEDSSFNVRLSILNNTSYIIKKNPLFLIWGSGFGSAEYYFNIYGLPFLSLHNWLLEVFLSSGIFIFVGNIIFYFYIMLNLFRVYFKTNDKMIRFFSKALFMSLITFCVTFITCSSVLAFIPYWALLGISLAVINIERQNNLKKKEECNV